MAAYYSHWAHVKIAPRTPPQWEAYKFCRAVKTGHLNDCVKFPWKDQIEVIDAHDLSRPRIIFGLFIKKKLFECGIRHPILIPVPSKDALPNVSDFRSYQMVREALQGDKNYPILPALRFTESLKCANAGGVRNASALVPYTRLIGDVPKGNIVLIDDFLTTGSSLRTACKIITQSKLKVSAAIVCGYSVHNDEFPTFGNHQLEIDLDEGLDETAMKDDPIWDW